MAPLFFFAAAKIIAAGADQANRRGTLPGQPSYKEREGKIT